MQNSFLCMILSNILNVSVIPYPICHWAMLSTTFVCLCCVCIGILLAFYAEKSFPTIQFDLIFISSTIFLPLLGSFWPLLLLYIIFRDARWCTTSDVHMFIEVYVNNHLIKSRTSLPFLRLSPIHFFVWVNPPWDCLRQWW
jgi:hypothetical protein